MWDLDYIREHTGAADVIQLGPEAINVIAPDGAAVTVTAKPVPGGWMLFARGGSLCNEKATIGDAVIEAHWGGLLDAE